jgi:hypothetical protein
LEKQNTSSPIKFSGESESAFRMKKIFSMPGVIYYYF